MFLLQSTQNEPQMKYRRFGRTGWEVSEIGYGMWGMASWSNSNDDESLASLQAAVDRGVNFFDTAYAYGNGRSENLLGQIVRSNPGKATLHRDQDSTERSAMARDCRIDSDAIVSTRSRRGVRSSQPRRMPDWNSLT